MTIKFTKFMQDNRHCRNLVIIFAISLFVLQPASVRSEMIIHTNARPDSSDLRYQYPGGLLKLALEITTEEYGSFTLSPIVAKLSRNRSLMELAKGNIHVYSTAARQNWEDQAIAIRIPLRKGILGYKLFLILDQNKSKFTIIDSIEELKNIRLGGGSQWTSSLAFKTLGFNVVGGVDYETLFEMLQRERFDYFPRGINEIYKELKRFGPRIPNMIIEPTLAIYIPNPVYLFVSKKYPELAKRIHKGLNMLIANGQFEELFLAHHKDFIDQSNLSDRQIFYLNNPVLSDQTPLSHQELWYKPTLDNE